MKNTLIAALLVASSTASANSLICTFAGQRYDALDLSRGPETCMFEVYVGRVCFSGDQAAIVTVMKSREFNKRLQDRFKRHLNDPSIISLQNVVPSGSEEINYEAKTAEYVEPKIIKRCQ